MKKMLFGLLIVFCFAMLSDVFSNQNDALQNLQRLVSITTANPRFQSFRMIGQPKVWTMVKQQQSEFNYNLQVGQRYIFMASGDRDSYDIDMYVYDPAGNLVGADQVTPQYNGGPGTDCGVFINPMMPGNYKVKVDLFNATEGKTVTMVMVYGNF